MVAAVTRIEPRSAAALVTPSRGRLTDQERRERAMSETALADQIIDLARLLGWRSLHIRPARTKHGWVTPVAGDGKGFPDLLLVRARDRRLVFAELKREVGGIVSPDQSAWLTTLGALHEDVYDSPVLGRVDLRRHPNVVTVEVRIWRPSDLRDPIEQSVIYEVLR